MQFIFKDQITDKLLFVIQRFELALKRTSDVADCDDLLRTPEGETKERLLVYYPGIPWRKIFAMRNIISHEYLSVDPEIITDIVKHNLSPLLVVLYRIQDDLNAGKHDAIFG